jgi:hypothetical protein
MSIRPNDKITIIDDSCAEALSVGREAVSKLPQAGSLSYFDSAELFSTLEETLPRTALAWTRRTAERDIAPLRNLSLLLSAGNADHITLLVDDDVTEFRLDETRRQISEQFHDGVWFVAGTQITGIDEEGTVDRLTRAIEALKHSADAPTCPREIRNLFRVDGPPVSACAEPVDCVSGGYMAYRLPRESIFAFPPGYNEDWLWCLDIKRRCIAEVVRLPDRVVHDPPAIKALNKETAHFELLGDLVFDLATQDHVEDGGLETVQQGAWFATRAIAAIPDDLLPSSYVPELLKLAQVSPHTSSLICCGLGVFTQMHNEGELEIDWHGEYLSWQRDAEKKRKSFALALGSNAEQVGCLANQKESLT